MNFDKYQLAASGTFKEHIALTPGKAELLDWSMGLAGETGEVCELVKHVVFHNEPADKMKLAKELGDVLWYVSAIAKSQDIELSACAVLNIAKLAHRYENGYAHGASKERHDKETRFEDTSIYQGLKLIIERGVNT